MVFYKNLVPDIYNICEDCDNSCKIGKCTIGQNALACI